MKIAQILLVLLSLVAVTKGADYISVLPLLLAALIELYVPKEFSWGFSGKENLFFKNRNISAQLENTIVFSVLLVLSIITLYFLYNK
jgi:hypothetical protein